jgi:hypothetical protein
MEVDIGTYTNAYTNYTNSTTSFNSSTTFESSSDDDDNQGVNDVCWNAQNTFWPSKLWSISLTHGICFENIPSGDATQMQSYPSVTNITFDEAIGTSSFTKVGSFYCWEWDQKLTGSLSSGTEIYSDEGYLFQICERTTKLIGNSSDALLCNNWEKFRSSYQSAKVAADVGIVFAVLAMIAAVGGGFVLASQGSRASQAVKTSLQFCCGLFFMLNILVQIVVQSQGAVSSINPYTRHQNVEAFGCQPSYLDMLNDDLDVTVLVSISTGSIFSIISIVIAAVMGGVCLTAPNCYNPACFPCCFAVYIPTTQTSTLSSPTSIQLTTISIPNVTVVNNNAGTVYQV